MTEATPLAAMGRMGQVRARVWQDALAAHQAWRLRGRRGPRLRFRRPRCGERAGRAHCPADPPGHERSGARQRQPAAYLRGCERSPLNMISGLITQGTRRAPRGWVPAVVFPATASYRACGLGSLPGWTGRGSLCGWARKDASCRSRGHSRVALGAGTPGRCLGTTTRSARGWMMHRTGVGSITVSPSIPTGISGESASDGDLLGAERGQSLAAPAAQEPDHLPGAGHPDGDHAQRAGIQPGAPAQPGDVAHLIRAVADQQGLRALDP